MASDMCVRRLTRELKALKKDPLEDPKITAVPNEDNILEWHYVIEGVAGSPFEGGFYHGKLIFPRDYPLKPPSVIMLTPSGRFETNRRLCLSMSDFHPESWNPMWSVSTILTGLYSFMMDTAPTLGSIDTTRAQKRRFAQESLDFNVRDPIFAKLFPSYVQLQKDRAEQRRREREQEQQASSLTNSSSSKEGPAAVAIAAVERPDVCRLLAPAAVFLAVVSISFAIRFL